MRDNPSSGVRQAFTLIEMLTVIAVVGIVATILVPVVSSVRQRAAATKSVSNLKQFGNAFQMFSLEHEGRLPAVYDRKGGDALQRLDARDCPVPRA